MKNWKRLTALGLSAMMLASLQGAVPQHQKQIRKAGKIRQQKIPEDQEKNHWKVHMYLCSNLQEIHLEI